MPIEVSVLWIQAIAYQSKQKTTISATDLKFIRFEIFKIVTIDSRSLIICLQTVSRRIDFDTSIFVFRCGFVGFYFRLSTNSVHIDFQPNLPTTSSPIQCTALKSVCEFVLYRCQFFTHFSNHWDFLAHGRLFSQPLLHSISTAST